MNKSQTIAALQHITQLLQRSQTQDEIISDYKVSIKKHDNQQRIESLTWQMNLAKERNEEFLNQYGEALSNFIQEIMPGVDCEILAPMLERYKSVSEVY